MEFVKLFTATACPTFAWGEWGRDQNHRQFIRYPSSTDSRNRMFCVCVIVI